MADSQYTRAQYIGRRGNHHIIGAFEMPYDPGVPSRRRGDKFVHYYGYAQAGHKTLVHNEDIDRMVNKWEAVPEVKAPEVVQPDLPSPVALKDLPPPTALKDIVESPNGLNIDLLPGVTPKIAKQMKDLDLTTKEKILAYNLTSIKGVAEKRAAIIKGALEN